MYRMPIWKEQYILFSMHERFAGKEGYIDDEEIKEAQENGE